MARTHPVANSETAGTSSGPPSSDAPSSKSPALSGLIALLLLAAVAYFAVRQVGPPAAVAEGAPATEFSSGRARKHVEAMAQRPHPVGSEEHAAVRAAVVGGLTSAGLAPEIQTATVISQRRGSPYAAAVVNNVVAQLKGTEPGQKALMLTAHYDSVPTGPGASDDASGVATLIETARVLKSGPPLKNDVTFLITDAEENGLLGAKAFADEHPLAKQVGLVLNFEARGNGGAVVMFETSARNGRLIEEFAKAAPHPVSNSLAYEVYKQLGNDTDLSIYKDRGVPGMNFAYFEGLTQYHTQLDTAAHADERSLQHQGSYAVALGRHFGNLKLDDLSGGDAAYFNLPGVAFVRYAGALTLPLAALTALVFAGVIVLGFRKKQLTVKGLAGGFLGFLISVALAPLLYTVVWQLRRAVHNALGIAPQADIYNARIYLFAFLALTAALLAALYALYRRRTSAQNLMAGGALGWLLLVFALTLMAPGASYVLLWPLLFSLLALGYLFAADGFTKNSFVPLAVASVGVIPAIMLLAPTINQVFNALVMNSILWISIIAALLFWLLIPQVELLTARRRWALPLAALALALGALVFGARSSGFDASKPQETHLFYAMNANTGAAVWASAAERPDEWTKQYLTDNPTRGAIPEYIPSRFNRLMSNAAPAAALAGPEIQLLDLQARENGTRVARLRVTSPRRAPVLTLVAEPGTDIVRGTVDGEWDTTGKVPRWAEGRDWGLNYYAFPAGGVEVTIEVASTGPIKLRAMDQSYGLPALPGQTYAARPANLMPLSFYYSDTTLVGKTFTF